jgi:hypothetical protein
VPVRIKPKSLVYFAKRFLVRENTKQEDHDHVLFGKFWFADVNKNILYYLVHCAFGRRLEKTTGLMPATRIEMLNQIVRLTHFNVTPFNNLHVFLLCFDCMESSSSSFSTLTIVWNSSLATCSSSFRKWLLLPKYNQLLAFFKWKKQQQQKTA